MDKPPYGRLGAMPTHEVFDYDELVDDLMLRIFNLTPYEFGITDDSSLSDFRGQNDLEDLAAMHRKILEVYGVDVSTPPLDRIIDVIKVIAKTR